MKTQPPDLVGRLYRIGMELAPSEAMITGVLVGLELEHRWPERLFRDRLHVEIARIQGITAEQVEAMLTPWELV